MHNMYISRVTIKCMHYKYECRHERIGNEDFVISEGPGFNPSQIPDFFCFPLFLIILCLHIIIMPL